MGQEGIAIVGASCRFPGGDGLEGFWQLLVSGRDAVSEVDAARWSTRFFYHPSRNQAGKSYSWAAGLIDGADLFDPAFFGISPREAVEMDPQQRVLLELVWHALEDAGLPAAKLAGSGVGVYIGASTTDYADLRTADPAGGDAFFMTGSSLSILSNRISHAFDLRGPSLTLDTACSSSLVALHDACEAIRGGRIPAAIVGGVNLLLAPYPFLGFCRAGMLSRRGRCFAFDARADGYVRGEGGGVVVLKPLAEAVAARDPIRAVILGTGVNSDGRTIGLSLPSEEAQAALVRAVHASAGVAADDLAFFEMHGTGTPAGDPVEAAAVGRALGQSRRASLPIGSVKTNIGHLEAASGMAGLIKAMLALDRGLLPPTLNCETPNPRIDFAALNLRLVREPEPIARGRARYAGVNSFGFGGTNAHVVLAAPPRPRAVRQAAAAMPPLLLSARSEGSLKALARAWRDTLAKMPLQRAAPAARAAARRREHHPHRLAVAAADRAATLRALADFVEAGEPEGLVAGTALRGSRLAFVFSGNGAQWPGMGGDAWRGSAAFRAAVEEADALLEPELGWSVAQRVVDGVDGEALARADVAQPLLFAVQVGIVRALAGLGLEADAHLGHSVGEIAAAWAAGALSLEAAVQVVLARSRAQQRTQGTGRMAALALGADEAHALIEELGSPLEVAALNGLRSVTVSGAAAEIERLAHEARRRGVACRPLDLDFAFHSHAMEPVRDEILAALGGLPVAAPRTRLFSSVTGEVVAAGALDAAHWWANIRRPVRFAEAVARVVGEGCRILVEIGPSPILQSYLGDGLRAAGADGRVVATLSRKPSPTDPFVEIAARCHVAGCDFSAAAIFDGPADPRGLPLYRWERTRFWFDKTGEAADLTDPPFDHPLLGFRQKGPAPSWVNHLDAEVLPWIADHRVGGVAVLPAAASLEIAFASARARWPQAQVLEAADIELRRPLPFDQGRMREMRTLVDEEGGWQLASRLRLSDEALTVHAVGRIAAASAARAAGDRGAAAPTRRLDAETLYALAREVGVDYGPRFRTVAGVEVAEQSEAIAHLDPSAIDEALDPYLLHPALLDGALQSVVALLGDRRLAAEGAGFLPSRFGRVRLFAPFGRLPRRARLRVTGRGVLSLRADIVLFDEKDDTVAEFDDCVFRRVELRGRGGVAEGMLHVDLVPAPLAEPDAGSEEIADIPRRLAAAHVPNAAGQERALLLDAAVAAAAQEALRQVFGCESVDRVRVHPDAAAIVDRLLPLLDRFDAVAADGGAWRLQPASVLPELSEVWRLLLAEAPEFVGELALVALAAEALPKIIATGDVQLTAALSAAAERLIEASPASSVGVEFLCGALVRIAALRPAGRSLRILEIGAGGGVATRRILARLAQTGTAPSYLATDADPERVAQLSPLLAPFAGAARWSPHEEGDPPPGAPFDIIVARNAGVRLRLDAAALSRLGGVLASDGLFLAVAPEPNPLWDMALGEAALRSGTEWLSALAQAGLLNAGTTPIAEAPWGCAAFWACAPPRLLAQPAIAAPPAPIALVGKDLWAARLGEHLAKAGHLVSAGEGGGSEEEAGPSLLFVAQAPDRADPAASAARQIAALARLAKRTAAAEMPLWLVTRGAQQAGVADEADGLIGAALWGMARTLANEEPRLALRLVDLPAAMHPEAAAERIAGELAAAGDETEIVWTPRGRHVPRLRRGLPPRWAKAADPLGLSNLAGHGLEGLRWEIRPPRAVGPGEIEIEVAAAGLNFRDIMWATGLLPEEALSEGFAGADFGLECSGVVQAVGPGVEGFEIGDRVMAMAPAALASRVVTQASVTMKIAPEISFAAAATVPVAFVTALYALGTLARLTAGECVLVHAAAGGVGLAAIQYAKHCGARVIATAGSPMKRAFLRLAGADHVLDSRDLAFVDTVRELTGGEGVDVVLNSLGGKAMEASLGVLKPFGRFLELGKRDFYESRRVALRPMRHNGSYFAIDVDELPVRRPDLARALLSQISQGLSAGTIRPLAHRVFPFAGLNDAFRLMQASGHIGKIVLVPDANRGVQLFARPGFTARSDGTYLVTGGIDGFGFEAARWLAARGARRIALLGRRGAQTPGAAARVAELAAAGAEVRLFAADVGDRGSLAAALDGVRAMGSPLVGVVHAAATIADGLAADLDSRRVEEVLRPKLAGAVLLDELTREDPIEFFLLYSSATSLLGAPGQGAYVAANFAIEALARRRCAAGRRALAVAWGPIEDRGYLAARPEMREALARRLGVQPMPAKAALAGLPAMLDSGLAVVAQAEADWGEARGHLPILAAPLFSEMRIAAGPAAVAPLRDRLAGLGRDEALALIETMIAEEAAAVLRIAPGAIDPARPLSEIGMDSLMAVELRLAIESRLNVDLPLMLLAEGTSVAALAARLAAAAMAGSRSGSDLLELAARYEGVDPVQSAEGARKPEAKPEAAE